MLSVSQDFLPSQAFSIARSAEQRVPFVFNSPHSGCAYPKRFLEMSRLDSHSIRRSEDCYVDELFSCVVALGAPLLCAHFPRAYLDVNREPWELDPRMFSDGVPPYANIRSPRVAGGLGTVPRLVGEGAEIYAHRLPFAEASERIELLYQPYHAELKQLLVETRQKFGFCVLIDCHSMPAGIQLGESGMRPDFIIGDRFGSSASKALSRAAIQLLDDRGFTVAHNRPYAGGYITEHYGRPSRGIHAIQIEINRGLYMDEQSLQKTSGFDLLARELAGFTADLMALPDYCFTDMPLAAE
ncbi:MAG: N-formylglutamate amidohydrolase [Rhizobiaceae bacterium]|nr:N-formylglutamate amidohydrolase [Rhizobiaceae bacterium]